jgi:DNA-binding PadR family transcriptional regulator
MPQPRARDPRTFAPLPPAALHILLAIGAEERHGYAIMGEVERITGGAVRMGPGTLYGTIKRLLETGLIEECGERVDPLRADQRRRYYRMTTLGRAVVVGEVERLQSMIERTGARTWAPGGQR